MSGMGVWMAGWMCEACRMGEHELPAHCGCGVVWVGGWVGGGGGRGTGEGGGNGERVLQAIINRTETA